MGKIEEQGQKPKTSKLAIAAMVFGVIPIFALIYLSYSEFRIPKVFRATPPFALPLFALIGLVLGIVAIVRIKKSKRQLTGQAAAILGVVAAVFFLTIVIIGLIILCIYGFPTPD